MSSILIALILVVWSVWWYTRDCSYTFKRRRHGKYDKQCSYYRKLRQEAQRHQDFDIGDVYESANNDLERGCGSINNWSARQIFIGSIAIRSLISCTAINARNYALLIAGRTDYTKFRNRLLYAPLDTQIRTAVERAAQIYIHDLLFKEEGSPMSSVCEPNYDLEILEYIDNNTYEQLLLILNPSEIYQKLSSGETFENVATL